MSQSDVIRGGNSLSLQGLLRTRPGQVFLGLTATLALASCARDTAEPAIDANTDPTVTSLATTTTLSPEAIGACAATVMVGWGEQDILYELEPRDTTDPEAVEEAAHLLAEEMCATGWRPVFEINIRPMQCVTVDGHPQAEVRAEHFNGHSINVLRDQPVMAGVTAYEAMLEPENGCGATCSSPYNATTTVPSEAPVRNCEDAYDEDPVCAEDIEAEDQEQLGYTRSPEAEPIC